MWDIFKKQVLPKLCWFLLEKFTFPTGTKKNNPLPWGSDQRKSHESLDQLPPTLVGDKVDPHEKLMASWSWSHADGGGHRTHPMGRNSFWGNEGGASKTKMKDPRWQLKILVLSYELLDSEESCQGKTMHIVISCSTFWCLSWHWGPVSFYDTKLTKASNLHQNLKCLQLYRAITVALTYTTDVFVKQEVRLLFVKIFADSYFLLNPRPEPHRW